jgi:pimeloyl-ACP methyl ester carboxylesterase
VSNDFVHCAYADVGHGQIHYAQCGPPGAAAVLLLHQTPRSWTEFRSVLPLLGQRYCAIAMDTAGFGASTRLQGQASIERWAQAAVFLLDALRITRAHVVGHHTGGVIAIELAAAYPARVDKLVLSSTPFTDAAFRRERAERAPIDEVTIRADGSHLAELWQRRQPYYPADRPELLHAFVCDALKVIDRLEEGHHAVARYRMEEQIDRVDQPVLVIRAGRDPFAAPHAQALCARLPQARLVEIADGMVALPDQLPEAFSAAVLDFLDGDGCQRGGHRGSGFAGPLVAPP